MQAFTWGDGGAAVTPDALAERRKLARVLMAQGSDTSPVQHWTQGAARIAQSLLGTYDMGQADKAERGARDASSERSKALLGALIGGDAPQSSMASIPVSAEAPSPSGGGIGAGGIRSPGMATVARSLASDAAAFPTPEEGRGVIQYSLDGKVRNRPLAPELAMNIERAVSDVYGPGYKVQVYSGGQGGVDQGGPRVGSTRHDHGNAGDVYIIGPDGQKVTGDRLAPLAQYWQAKGFGGTGLEMAGGGIHLDGHTDRATAWNYADQGGRYTPAQAAAVQQGQSGVMPSMAQRSVTAYAGVPRPMAAPDGAPIVNAQAQSGTMPARTPQQPVQTAQAQQPNASQIQGLMQIINDPWAKPGDKTAAQFLLQKRLTAETKDPVRSALEQEQLTAARNQNAQAPLARQEKQLSIQKSQRELDGTLPRAPTANMQEVDAENKARAAKGLPPMSVLDYSLAKAKASATNINMGGGTDKQVFDTMDESAKDAKSAVMGLQAIRDARASLQGGGVFGAGADAALQLRKIGAALGITGDENLAKITNTETFRSAIAPQVASILKATVGSANISNSDREFAEKAAGGAISLDQTSIAKLLDIMERGNMARIQSHQERLNDIYPEQEDGRFKRERALFRAPMPKFMEQGPSVLEGMSPPAPQTPAPIQQPDRAALEAEARRRGLMK